MEAVDEGDRTQETAPLGGLGHLQSVVETERQRFLTHDVLAGLQRRQSQLEMKVVGSCDVHDVDAGRLHELQRRGEGPIGTQVACSGFGALWSGGGHTREGYAGRSE
jgi:hypothetical protein